MSRPLRSLVVALSILVLTAACGEHQDGRDRTVVRVFAAASLTEAFTTLAHRFEENHPGARVQLNFGPSSGLAQQIRSGAPADVFASASPRDMRTLVRAGDAKAPDEFASNTMQIAVPRDDPAGVATLADLAEPGLKVALCQPQVPCGAAAREVFARAGLRVPAVTEEVDVKSVLTKVRLGEVDAGMVYRTDVRAAGSAVKGVGIPADVNVRTAYPVARVTGSEQPREAGAFIDLVLSDQGTAVLEEAGFGKP